MHKRLATVAFGAAIAACVLTGCGKTQGELALNNYNCLAASRSSSAVSANLESFVQECRQARLGPFSGIYADLAASRASCASGGSCDVGRELSEQGYIAR
ncbi:MAG: hypothetical protein ACI4NA_01870 [Succinivibrio sp.]